MKWKERLQADNRLAGIGILVAGVLIWVLFTRIGYWIILAFAVFLILALLLPPMWCKLVEKIRRYRKTRAFEKDLEIELYKALHIMDSVGSSYADEPEANKELVCILRAKGVDAIYKPREKKWSSNIEPDIKVRNTLIECKLDLDQGEADRLVGQAGRYSKSTGCSVGIVIYGRLEKKLENYLREQLPMAPIIYLENPKRVRKEPSPRISLEIK